MDEFFPLHCNFCSTKTVGFNKTQMNMKIIHWFDWKGSNMLDIDILPWICLCMSWETIACCIPNKWINRWQIRILRKKKWEFLHNWFRMLNLTEIITGKLFQTQCKTMKEIKQNTCRVCTGWIKSKRNNYRGQLNAYHRNDVFSFMKSNNNLIFARNLFSLLITLCFW